MPLEHSSAPSQRVSAATSAPPPQGFRAPAQGPGRHRRGPVRRRRALERRSKALEHRRTGSGAPRRRSRTAPKRRRRRRHPCAHPREGRSWAREHRGHRQDRCATGGLLVGTLHPHVEPRRGAERSAHEAQRWRRPRPRWPLALLPGRRRSRRTSLQRALQRPRRRSPAVEATARSAPGATSWDSRTPPRPGVFSRARRSLGA